MDPAPRSDDAPSWADLLRTNWQQRSASHLRDFYVASHPGWNRRDAWRHQADVDVRTLFHEIDPTVARCWQVLEIGCGVGRLVEPLLDRVAGYTGIDVASGMVDEARARCRTPDRARFFVGDGLGVPVAARDRAYDLALAHAVFIHCPRVVIEANLVSAWSCLRIGGQLRFQVLADPNDPEGAPPEAVEEVAATIAATEEVVRDEPVHDEMKHLYYMGDRFGFAELRSLMARILGEDVRIFRPTTYHMYVLATKRA